MWAASELLIVVYILGYASKFVASTDIGEHDMNQLCRPGKSYTVKCNRCTCDNYGALHCKRIQCPSGNKQDLCNPKKIFVAKCNECSCSKSGLLTCVVVGCKTKSRDDDDDQDEDFSNYGVIAPKMKNKRAAWADREVGCDLQDKVTDNCTSCYCGRRTLEECRSTCKVHRTLRVWPDIYSGCPYGKIYFDGCNTCRCDENFPFECKVDKCIDKITGVTVKYRIIPLPTTCLPGEWYKIDDCKTCKCSHPEWSCRDICNSTTGESRIYTADKLRQAEMCPGFIKNKRPDWPDKELSIRAYRRIDDGCKSCVIGLTGLTRCNTVQSSCIPREDDVDDFPSIKSYCPYGIQFFNGCNNCACISNRPSMPYVCTKKECPGFKDQEKKYIYGLPDDCIPGDVHMLDKCLACECSSDYVCTNICAVKSSH